MKIKLFIPDAHSFIYAIRNGKIFPIFDIHLCSACFYARILGYGFGIGWKDGAFV